MTKFKFLLILALLCITASGAWGQTLPTDGTGAYTIGSKTDWETFCTDVNNGITYAGETVTMTEDITDAVSMTAAARWLTPRPTLQRSPWPMPTRPSARHGPPSPSPA